MKRLIAFILLILMMIGLVACNRGGAPAETTAPVTEPPTPAPYVPTAADFSIVYASDASKDIKDAAAMLKYRIKTEYNVDVEINPETASAYEIALGGCREAATAIKETLGTNTYAIKAVSTANGVCIAAVGNNNRSTVKAIEHLSMILDETAWDGVLSLNVTDTLDYKYPKNISFYGDSITTYSGYSNSSLYNSTMINQKVWYNTSHMKKSETWWGIVLDGLDKVNICVNNSYSGDYTGSEFALGRAENLHTDFMNKVTNPDTIIVYFGINDCGKRQEATFRQNYFNIIQKMKETYPDATIFCCTLLAGHVYAGDRLKPFNNDIRYVADQLDVELIDLDRMIGTEFYEDLADLTIDTDNLHPNQAGMKMMGDAVIEAIEKWYYGE